MLLLINESVILGTFINDLKEFLQEEAGYSFSLSSDSYLDEGYDAHITYKTLPVAAIEVVYNTSLLASRKKFWGRELRAHRIPISIIFCNGEIQVREADQSRFKKVSTVQQLADIVSEYCSHLTTQVDSDAIKSEISNRISKYQSVESLIQAITVLKNSLNNLKASGGAVMMSEKDEDEFFMALLGRYDKGHLCRYTSIDNLFTTLDKCSHAMCCPVSMNDPNEGSYADSKLTYNVNTSRTEQAIASDNGCYILSCTDEEQEDDLTMWRLYADDAKGVCIQYEIDKEIKKNNCYFLAKVSYGERDGKHKALEFLNELMAESLQNGWYFRLSRWYIWRYFFKSHVYKSENEVRLLYMPGVNESITKIWYKDSCNGLFNHLVTFSISKRNNTFPLKLSKILIGPNIKSSRQNIEQIAYMVKDKNIDTAENFKVSGSSIKNYR